MVSTDFFNRISTERQLSSYNLLLSKIVLGNSKSQEDNCVLVQILSKKSVLIALFSSGGSKKLCSRLSKKSYEWQWKLKSWNQTNIHSSFRSFDSFIWEIQQWSKFHPSWSDENHVERDHLWLHCNNNFSACNFQWERKGEVSERVSCIILLCERKIRILLRIKK